MRWGWTHEHFLGVYQRLKHLTSCYTEIPNRHPDVFNAMENQKVWSSFAPFFLACGFAVLKDFESFLQPQGEQERAHQLLQLLGFFQKQNSSSLANTRFKTIEDVKRFFGQKAVEKLDEMEMMEKLVENMHRLGKGKLVKI